MATACLIVGVDGPGAQERIGGLTPWARLVLEAERLGVARITVWAALGGATPGSPAGPRLTGRGTTRLSVAAGPEAGEALAAAAGGLAAVVWVSATALVPAMTLRALLDAVPEEGEAVVVEAGGRPVAAALPAGAVNGAAGRARLLEAGRAADSAGFAARLLAGLRRRPLSGPGAVFLLDSPAERRAAERALLKSLTKAQDGFMSRHLERRISLAITRRLAGSRVTPNQVTLFSITVGLAGAACIAVGDQAWQVAGALLFIASSVIDGVDGELARLRFEGSRLGGWLDFLGDNVVHAGIFGAIAAAALRGGAGPHVAWLGAASIAAIAFTVATVALAMRRRGSASFTSVAPDVGATAPRLARLADALARRDFTYLVLLLALLGRLEWFLWLSAVGGSLYALVVAYLHWGAPARAAVAATGPSSVPLEDP
jgi:phosphatidylglycerophosphate synthase